MITAEQFIIENVDGKKPITPTEVEQYLIEFAQLHVKSALEKASENVYKSITEDGYFNYKENTIIDSYSLNNIK